MYAGARPLYSSKAYAPQTSLPFPLSCPSSMSCAALAVAKATVALAVAKATVAPEAAAFTAALAAA